MGGKIFTAINSKPGMTIKGVKNDLTTTEEGYVLDARQGLKLFNRYMIATVNIPVGTSTYDISTSILKSDVIIGGYCLINPRASNCVIKGIGFWSNMYHIDMTTPVSGNTATVNILYATF